MPRRLFFVLAMSAALAAAPLSAVADEANAFRQVDLVSDQPGKAAITDRNLVNPWGLAAGQATPLWVSDNGTDVSTLYAGATAGQPVAPIPLVVKVPDGAPTGQVFNDTADFVVPGTGQSARFVFASEHGSIAAWNQSVTDAVTVASAPGAIYKGLALVHSRSGPVLLATDFHDNRIDVFDRTFQRVRTHGLFRDRNLPRGYAPFNVAAIGDRVFVTYAQQSADRVDDVAGRGHGFIDVYTPSGHLVRRFASRGPLDSPWGLAIGPEGFGRFEDALLVGNFGDGRIHAYDPHSGKLLGTLRDTRHRTLVIDGLWALHVGNSVAGGPHAVWFSAGPDDETHGLLGVLRASG